MVLLFVAQIAIAIIAGIFGNIDRNAIFSMHWITYFCPIVRLIDFLFGCCLGYLFLKFKNRPNKSTCILLEILTIVLIIGSLYLYATHKTILGTEFIRYSLLFTPTTVSIIWLISKNGGIVSKLLQNNMLVKIGNLSPYTFLIHGLTIKLYNLVVPRLFKNIPLSVVAVISLLLTFVAAKFWIELEKNVSFRKR